MLNIKCISLIIFIWAINIFAQQTSPLTFSEIMFYPSETNGEFVEIYNTSSTETIDIANYKFKYYTSSNNNLIPLIGGTKLGPGKFAVILQGNYDFNNGIYKTLIPSDVIVLKVSSNNFGSSGMANTTSRTVYLIDPSGQTVDTYTYSADNSASISDEKIILNKDNSSSNWKNSLRTHGTPGFKNSVSPTDYDLQIKFLNINPSTPRAEDSLKITFVVINKGRLTANNFSVSIFNDVNRDSIEQAGENIFYQDYSELINGDSIVIQKSFYTETPGNYSFIAGINFLIDEVLTNNRTIANVTVAEKLALYNDIVVNEIMYAPINDEPEWIELYNRSNRKINLRNWKIADNSSSVVISNNDLFIDSNQFLIISKDASINNFYNITSQLVTKLFPTLNNTADDVILKDNEGRTIDSVRYNPSWGGSSGKSLERISADESSVFASNWGTSISKEKATPGRINSLTKKDYDISIKNFYAKSQYAIVNKELLFIAEIENKGKNAAQNVILKLFKDVNANSVGDESELLQMQTIQSISSNETVQLELTTDSITKGENNFILIVDYPLDEFIDDNTFTYKINGIEFTENIYDVVINEIMYAPSGDEPEWIELFNRSNHNINLKNWKVGDSSTLIEITTKDYELKSKEFLVISRDSSVVNYYTSIKKLIICSLPTMNNSGDAVVIKDEYNRTIDSTRYYLDWGGNNGKSLERKNVDLSSIDKDNWSSSTSKYNATPGKLNSISEKDYDASVLSFYSKSRYAEAGKSIVLSAIIKNVGKKKAENVEVQLFRDDKLIEKKEISVIETEQELQIEFAVENVAIGKNQFSLSINYSLDEYDENDKAFLDIDGVEIKVERGDIVINEIMYAPISPEPEWIEFYNRSEKEIDIKNYQIENEVSKNVIIKTSKIIQPKEYVTIAKDTNIYLIYPEIRNVIISNIPILNNNGGMIVISDSLGRTIDSVYYKSSWGGKGGKSLERIDAFLSSSDSANWKSSIDIKGTPNKKNSVTPFNYDIEITCDGITPLIAIIEDTIIIKFKIKNKGKSAADNFSFQLFNDINCDSIGVDSELIQTIDYTLHLTNLNPGDSILINHKMIASSIGDNCLIAKIVFNKDENVPNNKVYLKYRVREKPQQYNDIVINEIMYAPSGDEPEWIELFNRSN
ncbi:MAG: lamin tail domain-containing protein, partial [Melioribacter sp.]|nr:lamin tail domain-containing protein [Melioribacter sp.]